MPTQTFFKVIHEEQQGSGAFGPDEIAVMAIAFNQLLQDLKLVDRDDPLVRTVAKLVIEIVRNGERDPKQVRQKVLSLHPTAE
jgi:hypothetical protein